MLVPQLGLDEDQQALEQIRKALPHHEVISIPALEAVRRGGALNCISWNISTLEGYKNRAMNCFKNPNFKRIEEESAEYWREEWEPEVMVQAMTSGLI